MQFPDFSLVFLNALIWETLYIMKLQFHHSIKSELYCHVYCESKSSSSLHCARCDSLYYQGAKPRAKRPHTDFTSFRERANTTLYRMIKMQRGMRNKQ